MATISFIDVGEPTAQRKRKNANQARSIVMTERRRRQQAVKEATNKSRSQEREIAKVKASSSLKETLLKQVYATRHLLEPLGLENASEVSSMLLRQSLASQALSNHSLTEVGFMALRGYRRPVSKHMHMLINHTIKVMWPKYWPAKEVDGVSPLVKPWWEFFVKVPAVFHVFLYAAAVHYDDMIGHVSISKTPEILMHKDEALNRLRLSFKYGPTDPLQVCDQVLLAMTYLGFDGEGHDRERDEFSFGPFKPPNLLCSVQWKRHYAYAKENVHTQAANHFIRMKKEGLSCLSPPLAKSVAINDLQIAATHIRKPAFPFWDVPEIVAKTRDPTVNILSDTARQQVGDHGFQVLTSLGLTSDALRLMEQVRSISAKTDQYDQGHLLNPDYHILLCEKNHIHHDLLSMRTGVDLEFTGNTYDIHECCRIGGLLYTTGVLFPLPPSTGAPQRLIAMTKNLVQSIGLELCIGGGGKLLVWTLVLAAITAQDTLERPWLVRRLKPLMSMEGIKTWVQLKECCGLFLWMDSACNEAGEKLYDELSRPPYL